MANPLAVYLPRAIKAGAKLQADAQVTRILTDGPGKKVTGVEYCTKSGERKVQHASAVVLCAFTVENSRILLNSANTAHPEGLANRSGAVGRYLMVHPAVSISGLFPEDMQNYLGATGGQLLCQDPYGKTSDPDGAFGSRQWEIALALKPNDLLGIAMTNPGIFGPALHEFMQQGARHMGSMVGVCEDQPMPENRIELATQKDRFGTPLARTVYKISDDGRKLWKTAAEQGVRIFKAAGAKEAWHGPPAGQHIMGGTILGADATKSVLNSQCQSHDVANLFVGGPGVFPTSSSVNSTFTAHALAMKGARFLAENWASLKS